MTNKINIREALVVHNCSEDTITEAVSAAESIRAAGYDEETVKSLCESYLGEGEAIEGGFTIEKLFQIADPEAAWEDFWENTNA